MFLLVSSIVSIELSLTSSMYIQWLHTSYCKTSWDLGSGINFRRSLWNSEQIESHLFNREWTKLEILSSCSDWTFSRLLIVKGSFSVALKEWFCWLLPLKFVDENLIWRHGSTHVLYCTCKYSRSLNKEYYLLLQKYLLNDVSEVITGAVAYSATWDAHASVQPVAQTSATDDEQLFSSSLESEPKSSSLSHLPKLMQINKTEDILYQIIHPSYSNAIFGYPFHYQENCHCYLS